MLEDLIQKYKKLGIVNQLIIWNVIIFVISLVLNLFRFNFSIYFGFNTSQFYYLWTIFTYAFFHVDVIHLFFNMLSLYLFSILFFTFFNSKQLIRLYVFGIIFSVLIAFIIQKVLGLNDFLVVGASGAIATIFFAIATYSPNYKINLILFSLEIWILASVYFLIYLTMIYGTNQGGNLVHLGGAIVGILWGFYIKKGVELSRFIENILTIFDRKKPTKKYVSIDFRPEVRSNTSEKSSKQAKIDAILDKISKSGYDSLSEDEKTFLFHVKD